MNKTEKKTGKKELKALSDKQMQDQYKKMYTPENQEASILEEMRELQKKIGWLQKRKAMHKTMYKYTIRSCLVLMLRLSIYKAVMGFHKEKRKQKFILKKVNKGDLDFQFRCLLGQIQRRTKKGKNSVEWLNKEVDALLQTLTIYLVEE